jgi:hypothetical protein
MKFPNLAKITVTVLGFAFSLIFFSLPVFACDCVGPSGKQAITPSSAAFRGTVTGIEYLDVKNAAAEPRIIVTFTVSRVWSGGVKKSFILHTTENSWTCAGYYFIKGKEYLVVAYPNDEEVAKRFPGVKNSFGTHPCGATLPIESAKMQLIELGRGKKPKK